MVKVCSRPGCSNPAVAQLSYAYSLSRVELHPLGSDHGSGQYVLCRVHLDRLKAPQGWQIVVHGDVTAEPGGDPVNTQGGLDAIALDTLASQIRQVGGLGATSVEPTGVEHSLSRRTNLITLTSRAHLRVVADAARYTAARSSEVG